MRGLLYVLGFLLALATLVYVGFGEYPPYFIYRFQLSMDVEADGKVVTGSAVYEVKFARFGPLRFGEGPHTTAHWRGPPLTVDLGAKGLLFLTNFDSTCRKGSDTFDYYIKIVSSEYKNPWQADGPFDSLPLLVRFRNIDDVHSVEEVNPGDLAATFGPGVKLLRVRFQTTDAPVSSVPAVWPRWMVEERPVPTNAARAIGVCAVPDDPVRYTK